MSAEQKSTHAARVTWIDKALDKRKQMHTNICILFSFMLRLFCFEFFFARLNRPNKRQISLVNLVPFSLLASPLSLPVFAALK